MAGDPAPPVAWPRPLEPSGAPGPSPAQTIAASASRSQSSRRAYGIGPKKLAALRDLVTIAGVAE